MALTQLNPDHVMISTVTMMIITCVVAAHKLAKATEDGDNSIWGTMGTVALVMMLLLTTAVYGEPGVPVIGKGSYRTIVYWDELQYTEADELPDGSLPADAVWLDYPTDGVEYVSTVTFWDHMKQKWAGSVTSPPSKLMELEVRMDRPGCFMHGYIAYTDDGDETPGASQMVCMDEFHNVSLRDLTADESLEHYRASRLQPGAVN